MKVVLIKDVEGVGKAMEQKDVADGFARNFLIPNGLAEKADAASIAKASKVASIKEEEKKDELKNVQEDAAKIDGEELVFKMKAEGEKLFGSIDKKQVIEKLLELGMETKSPTVEFEKPIKELGEFPIKIVFTHGIEATIKVIVEKN